MERVAQVSKWLTGEGRFVAGNYELLEQFSALVVEVKVPLARSWFHIRALRPEFAGVSRIWRRGEKIEEHFLDHGFEKTPAWLNSPVRFVVERRKLTDWRLDTGAALPFPVLEELRAAGYVLPLGHDTL
jgi:adenylate cyclase